MSVDTETVKRVAKLSRIAIDDQQAENMKAELNAILSWVEQLNAVDVSAIEPMTAVVHHQMRMRDDVITDGGYADKVTSNAPAADESFFAVPKVVE